MNEAKVIKTERVGETFKITKQTEEILDLNALINRKSSLQYQAADLKRQMQQIKTLYDGIEAEIAQCDQMMDTLAKSTVLPEIK